MYDKEGNRYSKYHFGQTLYGDIYKLTTDTELADFYKNELVPTHQLEVVLKKPSNVTGTTFKHGKRDEKNDIGVEDFDPYTEKAVGTIYKTSEDDHSQDTDLYTRNPYYYDFVNGKKYKRRVYYKNNQNQLVPFPYDEDYLIDQYGRKWHKKFYSRCEDGTIVPDEEPTYF